MKAQSRNPITTTSGRFAAVFLAASLLAGACSDGGGEEQAAENPQQAFDEALEAFADYEGVTFVVSLDADAAALATDGTPEATAEAIVNSSLTISAKGTTLEDAQAEVTVDVDGNEDAVQLRTTGGSVYARAEVRDLVEAFDGDMAAIDAGVQQATAAGFDFAQALVDGEWVGVEGIGDLAQQFGLPVPTPDPEEAAAFGDRVAAIFSENTQVTSEGTDDTGAHLEVTVPLKPTLEALAEAAGSLGGAAAAGALPAAGLQDVPDADVPVDVWISDGRLVQIELDAVAIAEELGEAPPEDVDELLVRMTVDEFDADVETPEDFVEIDLEQILQGFFAAGSATESSGASTAVEIPGDQPADIPALGLDCADLEMLGPAEIERLLESSGAPGAVKKVRKACPELF